MAPRKLSVADTPSKHHDHPHPGPLSSLSSMLLSALCIVLVYGLVIAGLYLYRGGEPPSYFLGEIAIVHGVAILAIALIRSYLYARE